MFLILSLSQNEKTYPVAQKYKNPYYLMQNYYSVHPVPSEKCRKKRKKNTWIKFHIFTEKGWFFFLYSYSGSTWNLSATLIIGSFLSMYHFKSIFSRRVTSDHSLAWSIQNKEHFMPEASDKFNIPVCSARCVLSWAHWSLALLSIPCRTWGEIRIMRKF